jgi:ABC-type Fe3+ transport system permease subunit
MNVMRFLALILLLLGCLLIAVGHRVRRPRQVSRRGKHPLRTRPSVLRRLAGWGLTLLGFIAMLLAITFW